MSEPAPLPDGTYDALVVDANPADGGAVALELTILGGEHKGAVVQVASADVDDDPAMMLGIPATLTVDGGVPRVVLEP